MKPEQKAVGILADLGQLHTVHLSLNVEDGSSRVGHRPLELVGDGFGVDVIELGLDGGANGLEVDLVQAAHDSSDGGNNLTEFTRRRGDVEALGRPGEFERG